MSPKKFVFRALVVIIILWLVALLIIVRVVLSSKGSVQHNLSKNNENFEIHDLHKKEPPESLSYEDGLYFRFGEFVHHHIFNVPPPLRWMDRMRSRIQEIEKTRNTVIERVTQDCNFIDCDLIPLPVVYDLDSIDDLSVRELVKFRNDVEQVNYDVALRSCQRKKRLTKIRVGQSIRSRFMEMEILYVSFFGHGRLLTNMCFSRKINFTCGVVMDIVSSKEDADILFPPRSGIGTMVSFKHGTVNERMERHGKNYQHLVFYSTEPAITVTRSGVHDKYSIVGEHIDYMMHHTPFSDVQSPLPGFTFFLDQCFTGLMKGCDPVFLDNFSGREFERQFNEYFSKKKKSAQIAATMVSNCDAYYRTGYIKKLCEYMLVENYGGCDFCGSKPSNWPKGSSRMPMIAQYKFFFAFENSPVYNYISEKLRRAILSKFTIIVYMGALNIESYFRNVPETYKIYIDAMDFPDPRDLAAYLLYLDKNDTAYREYFQWRFDGFDHRNIAEVRIPDFCHISEIHLFGKKLCREDGYLVEKMMEGYEFRDYKPMTKIGAWSENWDFFHPENC